MTHEASLPSQWVVAQLQLRSERACVARRKPITITLCSRGHDAVRPVMHRTASFWSRDCSGIAMTADSLS